MLCMLESQLCKLYMGCKMNRYLSLQIRISGLYHFFLFFKYSTEYVCYFTIKTKQRLPGGTVVRTLCFHCQGPRFDPWSGNYDSIKPCGMTPPKKQQ